MNYEIKEEGGVAIVALSGDVDLEHIAAYQPARRGDDGGAGNLVRRRRRKHHAKRVVMIETGETGLAVASREFQRRAAARFRR